MKRSLITILLSGVLTLTLLAGCGSAASSDNNTTTASESAETEEAATPETATAETSDAAAAETSGRTYYYCAPYMGHPYIYDHFLGFKYAAQRFGCEIVQSGPDDFDTQAATEAFEQAIAKKPDGIITVMWDGSLVSAAKKAIDAGIPVICIEAAPKEHNCLTYIGPDTFQYGVDLANILLERKGTSGNIVLQGNWGSTNIDEMLLGVKSVLENTDWNILAEVNDEADTEKAIEVAKAAINSYPDADAFIGLNSTSGPGIAAAMEELGKEPGSITIICGAREDMTLEYIKEGYIEATLCNKTAMQAYMAVDMLESYYNLGLKDVPLSADNEAAGVGFDVFPETIYTGAYVMDASNVDKFLHENMDTYDTDLYRK